MNILNLFSGHTLLIGIILFLFLINLACIIYLVIRERKKDEEEIGEIITSLANAKPRDVEKPVIPEIEKEEVENMEEGNKARLEIDKVLEKMQKDLETTPEDEKRKQKEESVRNTKPKEDFEEIDFSKEQWHKGNYLEEKEKKNAVRAIETFDFMADEPIEEAEIDVIDIEETMELPKEAFDIHQNEKKENRIPEKKKFQNTDFISPIYGKLDEKEMDYPTVRQFSRTNTLEELLEEPRKRRSKGEDSFSDTLDVSPLHSEIEKNDEFLQNLKDFRESL